ncbi:MAG: hypothetical protein WC095_01785 [Candidatus Paceibacterota bacterium]
MSIKTFLMKKMLKAQMKGVPEAEQDKMIAMIEKNPELFQKMGTEIQAEMKTGKSQMEASMSVAKKYQEELKKIM